MKNLIIGFIAIIVSGFFFWKLIVVVNYVFSDGEPVQHGKYKYEVVTMRTCEYLRINDGVGVYWVHAGDCGNNHK